MRGAYGPSHHKSESRLALSSSRPWVAGFVPRMPGRWSAGRQNFDRASGLFAHHSDLCRGNFDPHKAVIIVQIENHFEVRCDDLQ